MKHQGSTRRGEYRSMERVVLGSAGIPWRSYAGAGSAYERAIFLCNTSTYRLIDMRRSRRIANRMEPSVSECQLGSLLVRATASR